MMRMLPTTTSTQSGHPPTKGSAMSSQTARRQSRRSRILLPPEPHGVTDFSSSRSVSTSFSLGTKSELLNRVDVTGNRRVDPQRIDTAPRRFGEREGWRWRFGQGHVGTGNPAGIDRVPVRSAATYAPSTSDSIRPLPAELPGPLLHNGPENRSWQHPELTEPASGCCQPTSRLCLPGGIGIPVPASWARGGCEQVSELVLIAATGLAREVLATVRGSGRYDVVGFLDDEMARTDVDGAPVLGTVDDSVHYPHAFFLVCLDSGRSREAVVERLSALGIGSSSYATVVDPSVRIPEGCRIGRGSILLQNVTLTASVTLGSHVVAMPGVTFTHDVVVADFATFSAGTTLGGGVRIGRAAHLGMNSSVRERTSIGSYATVGMGAAVLNDVPDGETWMGVPAHAVAHQEFSGVAGELWTTRHLQKGHKP